MPYTVRFAPRVEKALADLPAELRTRVSTAIDALGDTPRPPGCRAMQGEPHGTYRIRVGDHRVIYRVTDAVLLVLVIRVGNRRDVYR